MTETQSNTHIHIVSLSLRNILWIKYKTKRLEWEEKRMQNCKNGWFFKIIDTSHMTNSPKLQQQQQLNNDNNKTNQGTVPDEKEHNRELQLIQRD